MTTAPTYGAWNTRNVVSAKTGVRQAPRTPAAGRRWPRGAGATRSPATSRSRGSSAARGGHRVVRGGPGPRPPPARTSASASMSVCQSASRDSACPIARAIDASVSGPTKPESISAESTLERLDVGVGERRVVVGGVGETERPPQPRRALGRHAGPLGDLQPRVAARAVEQQPLERLAGVRDRARPRDRRCRAVGLSPWCARRARRTATGGSRRPARSRAAGP